MFNLGFYSHSMFCFLYPKFQLECPEYALNTETNTHSNIKMKRRSHTLLRLLLL